MILFIAHFLDPLQFLVVALVVWLGFQDNNKVIIVYAAIAGTIVNVVVFNMVSIFSRPGISLMIIFPAALLQGYIVFRLKSRRHRQNLAKTRPEESE